MLPHHGGVCVHAVLGGVVEDRFDLSIVDGDGIDSLQGIRTGSGGPGYVLTSGDLPEHGVLGILLSDVVNHVHGDERGLVLDSLDLLRDLVEDVMAVSDEVFGDVLVFSTEQVSEEQCGVQGEDGIRASDVDDGDLGCLDVILVVCECLVVHDEDRSDLLSLALEGCVEFCERGPSVCGELSSVTEPDGIDPTRELGLDHGV